MAGVFLSYRREDSRADTGRLADRLSAHFGADSIFMDIDDIAAGENFVEKLQRTLEQCDALLLVIGPHWHNVTDAEGRPRLASPQDFVRLEAQTALERGIPLVPVLVGGARMPDRGELPSQLAGVVLHQALEISDARFHDDVDRLIAVIEQSTDHTRPLWKRPSSWLAVFVIAAFVAAGAGYQVARRGSEPAALRSTPATLSAGDVRTLVVSRDYYDAQRNSAGHGIAHAYTTIIAEGQPLIADASTGLAWQKSGSGRPTGYDQAVQQVRDLAEQRYAGFDDWRLPTLEEALSVMEPMKAASGYHLDPLFEASTAPILWTADGDSSGKRWVVYYYDGVASLEPAQFGAHVRAVRTLAR